MNITSQLKTGDIVVFKHTSILGSIIEMVKGVSKSLTPNRLGIVFNEDDNIFIYSYVDGSVKAVPFIKLKDSISAIYTPVKKINNVLMRAYIVKCKNELKKNQDKWVFYVYNEAFGGFPDWATQDIKATNFKEVR